MTSAVYLGDVKHRRFAVKEHRFSYPLYMMWVDLNNPQQLNGVHKHIGTSGLKALKFNEADYLKGTSQLAKRPLIERAHEQLANLGITETFTHIYMLGQLRCFGVYFSPVNFYFFGHNDTRFKYMIAEVSNTPWNERHYYLVPLEKKVNFKKVFSVSPFMNLDMNYHWHVKQSPDKTLIHIENKRNEELLFDATLRLKRKELTKEEVNKLFKRFPAMTWSIFKGIYYQALKLFIKRVPFLGHSGKP
ncbi:MULTISPECIES: DUF1365 domain-containing protein [Pseudoalteromonas]|uniref:DUF1365 domain-containing protein n=1 Tax=Pseudoalteromonas TaxID=53246 RepID=UPI00160325A5|nr:MULTISPECIES: DUF1365 domain-containing protein [unclassified Pseudoalteromonas]MBB1326508.1 DUF1365 domain-containing protein [Pseudoalteromonas sp. SR45-1]MBB1401062.1 DUF1365 domain-containing protein [Pseudoalteromonas sp. SG45-1]MBB1443906.1 DUF1365 domain-containing protein [Pseudoalteromonas sp. SG43-3]MBB1454180.1 DUF1365 domain-containing protein [Pseudoalteromonas sp. SG43-5]